MILDMMPILSGAVDKLDFDFSYQIAADSIVASVFADVDFEKPMRVQGYVKNMAGYMVLHADVELPYATACARCAEPVYSELEISFEKDIATGDVSRDNDDYIFIEDKKLDLVSPVEEQIMLEMPSKTLCREDCKGLCQKCGKNLNDGDCDCEKHEIDPRLAILKTLLK